MTFRQRDDPAERLRALLDAGRSGVPSASAGSDLDDHLDVGMRQAEGANDDQGGGDWEGFTGDDGRSTRPGPGHRRALDGARHARPPAVTAPLGLRERFIDVTHPVVVTMLLAAVAAGLLFGLRVVRARADAVPVPAMSGMSLPGGGPTAATRGTGHATPATSTQPVPPTDTGIQTGSAGEVRVHVVGQVKRPGVVEIPAGSRVLDAIEAAGGASSKADLDAINLARAVVDGEQIQVVRPGETPSAPPPGPGAAPGRGTAGAGGSAGAKVSLNAADSVQLDSLPGVGPVLAQRILDWRSQNGRFASIEQLGEVSGIGEKLLAQLSPLVTL